MVLHHADILGPMQTYFKYCVHSENLKCSEVFVGYENTMLDCEFNNHRRPCYLAIRVIMLFRCYKAFKTCVGTLSVRSSSAMVL